MFAGNVIPVAAWISVACGRRYMLEGSGDWLAGLVFHSWGACGLLRMWGTRKMAANYSMILGLKERSRAKKQIKNQGSTHSISIQPGNWLCSR